MRRSLAALALLVLLPGCGGDADAVGGPRPAPSPSATPTRALLAAGVSGPVLPAAAGSLSGAALPVAVQRLGLDVAFGGVDVGPAAGGTRDVVYPRLVLTVADDGRVLANVKLPRFRCAVGTDLASAPRSACSGRTVEYGDADARSVRLRVDADDVVTVEVDALGYRYGAGVDRAPGLSPRPTGRRVHLRAVVQPGEVLQRTGDRLVWRPLAEVAELGPGGGTATQDDGYNNTYRSVLGAR